MPRIALSLVALFIFSGLSYAALCSFNSYTQSCDKCSFDGSGKMDRDCMENYEGNAKSCLLLTYPKTSAAYNDGKCPEVDLCVANLETCRVARGSGSDQKDCANDDFWQCFRDADSCVSDAAYKCSKETGKSVLDMCGGPTFILFGALALGIFRRSS